MDFTADIFIPSHHPCFEGHFPGHPIFPAVAQMDLLLELLEQHWQKSVILVEIRKAKFPAPITPDSRLKVDFDLQEKVISWKLYAKDQIHSTGTLVVDF